MAVHKRNPFMFADLETVMTFQHLGYSDDEMPRGGGRSLPKSFAERSTALKPLTD